MNMYTYTRPTRKIGKQWINDYDFEGYWRNVFIGQKIKFLADGTIRRL